jgi:hypothetical protein
VDAIGGAIDVIPDDLVRIVDAVRIGAKSLKSGSGASRGISDASVSPIAVQEAVEDAIAIDVIPDDFA